MNAEQLFPNLGTCKKLKELGFPQDTYFCHHPNYETHFIDLVDNPKDFTYAAPTFQEIWNQLPKAISLYTLTLFTYREELGYYEIDDFGEISWKCYVDVYQYNLAQSAAELWIKLKEQNLI